VLDMSNERSRSRMAVSIIGVVACVLVGNAHAAGVDFVAAVEATHPLAYFRLDVPIGKSLVGLTTYAAKGGVASGGAGAPIGMASNHSVQLDGRGGYIVTTQSGGVGETASMMAWVKLADLPSKAGHFFYVEGESQNGNDLDLQIETDNVLKFYTASGGNLAYAPPPATLVGQWHLIVATLDTATQSRVIYWDGKQVAADKGGGRAGKTGLFSIGASTVFSGRFFHGEMEEAALWNRALKPTEVAAIYATCNPTASKGGAGPTAAAGGSSPEAGGGPFATTAKVSAEDEKGPVKFKRQEQIAMMFLTAIEGIEFDCWQEGQRVCKMSELLTGPVVGNGKRLDHLKFDPNTDPNYTYALTVSDTGWQLHVNAKKPGLMGFCLDAHNFMIVTVTYNLSGVATITDTPFTGRGIEGDSFRAH
jgi:hypothetical protein